MRWIRPIFLHFHVERAPLAARLPPGVTLDGEAGHGVVSVVALGAEGPAPGLVLGTPLRALLRYRQLNVRTYVVGPEGPGIFLLDARVDSFWPLAARLMGMPYRRDGVAIDVDDSAIAVRASGITVRGLPAPGRAEALVADSEERSLLDRYVTYGRAAAGPTYAVRVTHGPWLIRKVEVAPDSAVDLPGLTAVGELAPARVVSAQVAETMDVTIDTMKMVEEPRGRVRRAASRLALNVIDAAL